jgi:catechol 2,3-dioxygenase-like lactoylglutathione lyase family enzyme
MPTPEFPSLTHVALTVRDLSVSVPWYETLLDAKPVLDEDTDPDLHHTVYLLGNGTLLGLHQHGTPAPRATSTSSGSAWTMSPSASPTGPSWRSGPSAWTSWASPTAASRTPPTGPASASATPTGSRSSSSPRPPDTEGPGGRLHLSPRTVEKHVASLLAKTGGQRRTQLAKYAAALSR